MFPNWIESFFYPFWAQVLTGPAYHTYHQIRILRLPVVQNSMPPCIEDSSSTQSLAPSKTTGEARNYRYTTFLFLDRIPEWHVLSRRNLGPDQMVITQGSNYKRRHLQLPRDPHLLHHAQNSSLTAELGKEARARRQPFTQGVCSQTKMTCQVRIWSWRWWPLQFLSYLPATDIKLGEKTSHDELMCS